MWLGTPLGQKNNLVILMYDRIEVEEVNFEDPFVVEEDVLTQQL